MASQTFLARDIFAAYWGLVILGFLGARRPIGFPAGNALRRYVEMREREVDHFLSTVEAICSLDPRLMKIARDEAPWSPGEELSEDELCSDVSLVVGRLVEVDELRGDGLDALLAQAANNLVEKLIDGLVAALYSFGERSRDPAEASRDVLHALATLLGEESIPGRAAKTGYARWSAERLPAILAHEESDADYKSWLC